MDTAELEKKIINDILQGTQTFTPLDCDNHRILLCAWYEQASQELVDIEVKYAQEWLDLKKEDKTNAEVDKIMDTTDTGKKRVQLKLGLKAREKMIGALRDRMKRLNEEARNQY